MRLKTDVGYDSRASYDYWAKYCDEDYDQETDPEPRVWLAWYCLREPVNIDSATTCLLNCWSRDECPDAHGWDEARRWLSERAPAGSSAAFETAAVNFAADLATRRPLLAGRGSPTRRAWS
jgi:hypothetical protein